MGIARMVGVGSSLSDPNSYAASVLSALPVAKSCWGMTSPRWLPKATLGYIALSLLCIVLTGSRTAFVGMGLLVLILALRSEKRFRYIVLLLLVAPLGWTMMPEELKNRFYTLIDPSVGPANAQESAEGRTEGWRNGFRLIGRFPLTGCGPGALGTGDRGFHRVSCPVRPGDGRDGNSGHGRLSCSSFSAFSLTSIKSSRIIAGTRIGSMTSSTTWPTGLVWV